LQFLVQQNIVKPCPAISRNIFYFQLASWRKERNWMKIFDCLALQINKTVKEFQHINAGAIMEYEHRIMINISIAASLTLLMLYN